MKKSSLIRFLPSVIYFFIIWFFSSSEVSVDISNSDKTLHVLAYTVMGILLSFSFGLNRDNYKKLFLVIIIVGILLGLIDEIHQYFVPSRHADVYDLLADSVGVITGVLWYLTGRIFLFDFIKK